MSLTQRIAFTAPEWADQHYIRSGKGARNDRTGWELALADF
jgi:hypothetical protein